MTDSHDSDRRKNERIHPVLGTSLTRIFFVQTDNMRNDREGDITMGEYRMNKAPRVAFLPDMTRASQHQVVSADFAPILDKEIEREEIRYPDAVAREPNIERNRRILDPLLNSEELQRA